MYGDLLASPLDNLASLFDELVIPILNNPENQKGWTQVIVNDVKAESQDFRDIITKMKGHMINRSILPLPICVEEVMEMSPTLAAGNLEPLTTPIRHSLELIVVKWFGIVKEVAEISPDDVIYIGDPVPHPDALFKFWDNRLDDLENMADQLANVKVRTIGHVLEKVGSVFSKKYQGLVNMALESLTEARDITMYFYPLVRFCLHLQVSYYLFVMAKTH